MSELVTFDGAPPDGTINFGVGQPSADLMPLELVAEASETFFKNAQSIELNYGVKLGDPRFLQSLADFLQAGYHTAVESEELFVTGGNSQALDLVSSVFAKPGDTVFVEEPSYFLAFKIFRDHDLNIVSIPMDEDGLLIEELKLALGKHRPAFLYTIPSFQNPCGLCTSEERRQQIVDLARQHEFLIVADEVYQFLYYDHEPPPAYATMTDCGRVLSLGSFSKILAPGMRLGWIQTSPSLRKELAANGFVNSGGSINHISSLIVRQAMENNSLRAHMEKLRLAYASRVQAMEEALLLHFQDLASWTRPHGGYFFWLEFDKSVKTKPLRKKAQELNTGFQPGPLFTPNGGLDNCLRLSFAHYPEKDIHEGIARLRKLFYNRPRQRGKQTRE